MAAPLAIRNLDRVIFPRAGTTKAQLLDYYVRVADAILPHLRDRLLHMHRYPEGVEGPRFWQKQCPAKRPEGISSVPVWSRDKRADIDYCVVDALPGLLWAVNIGSIELHTSLHTRHDLQRPTSIAFDLDPGEGVGIVECAQVALWLRHALDAIGLRSFAKTSGSKGLQVYAPIAGLTYAETKPLARSVAEALEGHWPERVVSRMARRLRAGKVLVDWGQNTEHKSTVCAYSVRAKTRPTVSTPLRWEEVDAAAQTGDAALLVFEIDDVLQRVQEDGDLFADVLTLEQRL